MKLRVLLGDTVVGHLRERPDHYGAIFVPDASWAADPARPVLGQTFEDDPGRIHETRGPALPAWFSNLLPEGVLREELLRGESAGGNLEWSLLRRLGGDLPGAVVVQPVDESDGVPADANTDPDTVAQHHEEASPLKFSLAGVQLKFSALLRGRRFVLPADGVGGEWIVKTPDRRFPGVPVNEFVTMEWARAAGFDVPETRLVPRGDLEGIDDRWDFPRDEAALAVRRFDRRDGGRIHMEDLAQVLNVRPGDKYRHANYETLARVVSRVCGVDQAIEFVRRLVFVVASANGDAHLKNWTLLYGTPRLPTLSPLYDQVVTAEFIPNDSLGLNLARSKAWDGVTNEGFRRLARKVELPEDAVVAAVGETVARVRDAYRGVAADYPAATRDVLARHWARVPLLGGALDG